MTITGDEMTNRWLAKIAKPLNPLRGLRHAKALEDTDPVAMMQTLNRSLRLAAVLTRFPVYRQLFWEQLVQFFLATLHFDKAQQVADLAVRGKYPGSADCAASLTSLIAETQRYRTQIEQARRALLAPSANAAEAVPAVLLPTGVFTTRMDNSAILGVRAIFAEIFDQLRACGIPFTVRPRLSTHGTPRISKGTRYISHHTIDPKGTGLHIKVTDRPNCFSFDRWGYCGWSEFASRPLPAILPAHPASDAIDHAFEADREQVIGNNVSKYVQTNITDILPDRPWIFVALQTIHDPVQQLAAVPMLDMLGEVAAHAASIGCPVVVKRHPLCGSKPVEKALREGVAKGLFIVSQTSIHTLIAGCVAVCTVNSSVGAEALLHLKPVYLFGAAEYQQACFRVGGKGAFSQMFHIGEMPISTGDLKRYLFALRNDFAIDISRGDFPERLRDCLCRFLATPASVVTAADDGDSPNRDQRPIDPAENMSIATIGRPPRPEDKSF